MAGNLALGYVKRAPFAPRTWEELKALLLKHFQPRDQTATYKAQFRARRRCNTEEIYSYVEALQSLSRHGVALYGPPHQGGSGGRPVPARDGLS